MTKICVIGSSGYIGSKITALLTKKYRVITLSRQKAKTNSKIFKHITGDLKSQNTIDKIVNLKPNFIIYAASFNHFESEKNFEKTLKNNNLPLARLCESILKNKNFKKIIYFSTFQVYGNYQKLKVINEETEKNPMNFYGLSHSINEEYLKNFKKKFNLNYDIIRLSNAYGYPQLKSCNCWWLVINDLCKDLIYRNQIKLNSNGKAFRNFITIDEVANFVKLLINLKHSCEIYNLVSKETIQIKGIVKKIILAEKIINRKINYEVLIKDKKVNYNKIKIEKPKFAISDKKIKKIGFKNKITLNKGIKKLLNKIYLEKIISNGNQC